MPKMEERVEDYWNISQIWRGKLPNTTGITVAGMINALDDLRYDAGMVAIRAEELCHNVIHGRRNRKKKNPPPNLLHLALKTQNNSQQIKAAQ